MRCAGIAGFFRERVQLVQTVVHAAVLHAEHAVRRLSIPAERAFRDPIAEVFGNRQRRRISAERITIDQSRKQFVHRVPRHPRFRFDIRFPLLDVIELRFHAARLRFGRRPEKALFALAFPLAFGKPVHHAFQLCGEFLPLRRANAAVRDSLRKRGEIMPHRMTRNEVALPAAVPHIGRTDPRVLVKSCQKTPVVERKQIRRLLLQRVFQVFPLRDNASERKRFHLRIPHTSSNT